MTRPAFYADSIRGVAAFFDVSPSTVKDWRAAGAPMEKTEDGYELGAISRWRFSQPDAVAAESEAGGDLADADARRHAAVQARATADADVSELRADRQTGRVVRVRNVVAAETARMRRLVEDLEQAPRTLSVQCVGMSEDDIRQLVTLRFDGIVARYEAAAPCRES